MSEMKGILPDHWRGLDEAKIRELLRKDAKVREEYLQIDFDWMHRELSDKHVTVNLLHEEYVGSAEKSGLEAFSRSQFFTRYRAWCTTSQ